MAEDFHSVGFPPIYNHTISKAWQLLDPTIYITSTHQVDIFVVRYTKSVGILFIHYLIYESLDLTCLDSRRQTKTNSKLYVTFFFYFLIRAQSQSTALTIYNLSLHVL